VSVPPTVNAEGSSRNGPNRLFLVHPANVGAGIGGGSGDGHSSVPDVWHRGFGERQA